MAEVDRKGISASSTESNSCLMWRCESASEACPLLKKWSSSRSMTARGADTDKTKVGSGSGAQEVTGDCNKSAIVRPNESKVTSEKATGSPQSDCACECECECECE